MSAPRNTPAPGAPFFTPVQDPPVGTALSESPPTLFSPITLRGLAFQNRVWVAPMCTYSAYDGHLTPFHLVHLGSLAYRGASLTIIEATAVQAEGRITPECSGLWKDSQISPMKDVVDFIHSQGQKVGVQLAHAGRKASTVAPWLAEKHTGERGLAVTATADVGGWPEDLKAMSSIPWGPGYANPQEMTVEEIKEVIQAFADAAKRAIAAGVDTIEIHAAHGYLLCSTLSPISNQRSDSYGGSWENRTRMLVETIAAVRAVIPSDMPLLLRISTTEWMEDHPAAPNGSWKVSDSIRLAKLLPSLGVDLLDCSSGGNHPAQTIGMHNDSQVGIAGQIRAALREAGVQGLSIGCVGMITEAEMAREAVQEGFEAAGEAKESSAESGTFEVEDEQGKIAKADVVLVARQFLREPEWILRVAHRLGVKVQWPQQYHRGQFLRGSRI